MRWTDPIVQEVRAAREKLWEECGYDFDVLCERLKEKRASCSAPIATKTELLGKKHNNR